MPQKKLSLSAQILMGLGLGVACGLFFGEYCAPLKIAGDAFIGLLQMTVLPYIVVSLVGNIGGITWAERRGLLKAGIVVLLLSLQLGVFVLVVVPLAFPPWDAASFFSSSLALTKSPCSK